MGLDLNKRGRDKLRKMAYSVGLDIESNAKRRAPVDTGRLMNSVTAEDRSTHRRIRIVVGSDVDYALYVEKGTKDREGQPFLVPAAKEEIRKL